jgi:predicted glycoside hydrolase/deacetylase ChbG (UPF0249 family)
MGSAPSHVDGHQHIHIVPELTQTLAALLAGLGVRTTRIPDQHLLPSDDSEAARFHFRVAEQAAAARAAYARAGIRSTPAFEGLDLMGKRSTTSALRAAVRRHLTEPSLELMTHPGLISFSGDAFNQSPDRPHELQVLCSHPFDALLDTGEVQLASFADPLALDRL